MHWYSRNKSCRLVWMPSLGGGAIPGPRYKKYYGILQLNVGKYV